LSLLTELVPNERQNSIFENRRHTYNHTIVTKGSELIGTQQLNENSGLDLIAQTPKESPIKFVDSKENSVKDENEI
jgi:hypothetical protein